jgi:hypothetical protein
MFYTVIKLDGHLKTRDKCLKCLARYFNIYRVFSNVRRVLSQYKTWFSLLYLLNITQISRSRYQWTAELQFEHTHSCSSSNTCSGMASQSIWKPMLASFTLRHFTFIFRITTPRHSTGT